MAITPTISAPQGGTLVTSQSSAASVRVPQTGVFAAYNIPAVSMRATYGGTEVLFRRNATIEVTQAGTFALARGRIANPKLRAWTFSLDGHDFYVLRLGDTETLVYDLTSEQWVDWRTFDQEFWRINIGINWEGGIKFGDEYGSNVLVGDDTFGLLWFLDPTQPYDEAPDYLDPVQRQYFERVLMGQVVVRGRTTVPCYAAFVTANMGDPAYIGAAVNLYTSDDNGNTFDDQGAIVVPIAEYDPKLSWYSLGQIEAPGRLFKIVDDGAVARIDSLEMNDPQ